MSSWVKSTDCSASGCVEVSGPFRKSTASSPAGHCVEVTECNCGDDVLVRDSKDPEGHVLRFTRPEWVAFIAGAKRGEFDLRN